MGKLFTNKEEFIEGLIKIYPHSFNENNTGEWKNAYKRVLPDEINFDVLFDDMIVNHQKTIAPAPAFFVPFVNRQMEKLRAEERNQTYAEFVKEYEDEKKELEKSDRPVGENFKMVDIQERIDKGDIEFKGFFDYATMTRFRAYSQKLPTEKKRCEFWKQVCSILSKGAK